MTHSPGHDPALPYRLFFDSSNDAMFVIPLSPDGQPQRFHDVNDRACELLGYSRERMLGFSPVDLGASFNLQRWRETSEALDVHGELCFEASFLSRQGRTLWVEVSVKRVELDGITLAMAIARDISQRVEAEQALRENERDLNALINANPETVILTAADSTIIHCNQIGAERLGGTPAELVGRGILDLSPPDIRPQRQEIINRIARMGQTVHFQDFRNGMHLDHTITPIGNLPGAERIAVFSRDVTARFIRQGIENLLGDIDRCILKGGDMDDAAVLVCEQLAETFYSPWVCIGAISGVPFKNGPHHCGPLGDLFRRMTTDGNEALSRLPIQESIAVVAVNNLPAALAKELTLANCSDVVLVPVAFNDSERALLLVGLQPGPGFRHVDVLDLLDHVASRLRVAWGMTHELQQLNLLRQALETARTAVLLLTNKGKIIWCNQALSDAIGTAEDAILGRQSRDFLVDTPFNSLKSMDATVKAGQVWTGECDVRRADGSVFTALQSVSPVYEENGALDHYIVIQEDITARKQSQERIRYLAEHDPLTGLHNRMSLMKMLETLLGDGRRSATELSLLYLDIDHFKPINDRYGHAVGDQLLVQFANRIRSVVRQEDLVCRLGGDEFVLVLRYLSDPDAAAQVAQNLLDRLGEPIRCGELELNLGVSIGISVASAPGSREPALHGTDLLREADKALYQAKRNGRNHYVFYTRGTPETSGCV